jgi:hypothetical protein
MFKFNKPSAAAVAPATTASVAPDFPSREAVAKIRELHGQIENLKTELATAEHSLGLAGANKDAIELSGEKKFEDVVRARKTARDLVKRNLSRSQNVLRQEFIDGGKRCTESRAEAWTRLHQEIVRPQVEKVSAAQELLECAAAEIVALLKPDSETTRRLEAIDEATKSWNTLCDELAAPGNARLNVTPATKTLSASFLHTIKFRSFEIALSSLRDALNPPNVPVRITEESLQEERDRDAARQHRLNSENERRKAAEATLLEESERRRLLGANKV